MNNEEIVQEIKNGYSVTDNMEWLYNKNLPLIKEIVLPYTHYEPMEDLLQEAYFGLWQAVERYNTSENVKFMTYARYWIKQSVSRYVEKCGSCIKLSNHIKGLIRRYKKYVNDYVAEYHTTPNKEQIQRDLELSQRQIDDIRYYMQDIKSLDEPIGENADGEAYTLSDILSDNKDFSKDIVEQEYKKQLCQDIWFAVEHYLSDNEKNVIRLSYEDDKTLDSIGETMGISLQRVKQLKAAGLRHLRTGKAKRLLMNYLETDKMLYTGCSVKKFESRGSNVENAAVRRVSLEEWIKKEIERRMIK